MFITKEKINNFEKGNKQEWLLTNGIGGFAAGTVLGSNSRRYHGLLFSAFNPPADRKLVVSSCTYYYIKIILFCETVSRGDIMKGINFVGLPIIIKDFLVYLDVIKNKSTLTIEEYSSDLRLFFKFLKYYRGLVPSSIEFDEIDILDIDDEFVRSVTLNDAYAFLSYCKNERDNQEAARARKVSCLRTFFKYLDKQKNIIETNPMEVLDSPRLKKSLPKYLTLEESIKLLKSVDGKHKERDYCILVFFLNCGLRLSELVSLNYNDIRDDHTLRVTGKGNKERTIYLNDACLDAYAQYMAVRPVDGVAASDRNALFLSSRNKRISPKTVQHIVYDCLEKCGLEGYSVHKLRHTAATLMYQHGNVDVLILKDILGHENLGTTEIYTHIVDEQLKKASESNPLANIKINKAIED